MEYRKIGKEEQKLHMRIDELYNEIRKLQSDLLYMSMLCGVDLEEVKTNEQSE